MVIFNSYVKLPEGKKLNIYSDIHWFVFFENKTEMNPPASFWDERPPSNAVSRTAMSTSWIYWI